MEHSLKNLISHLSHLSFKLSQVIFHKFEHDSLTLKIKSQRLDPIEISR